MGCPFDSEQLSGLVSSVVMEILENVEVFARVASDRAMTIPWVFFKNSRAKNENNTITLAT